MVLAIINKSALSSFIPAGARALVIFALWLQLQTFTSSMFPVQQKFSALDLWAALLTLLKGLVSVGFLDFAPNCPDIEISSSKHTGIPQANRFAGNSWQCHDWVCTNERVQFNTISQILLAPTRGMLMVANITTIQHQSAELISTKLHFFLFS